jgi:hypothetical protein
MEIFIGDEAGYAAWLRAQRDGFVINAPWRAGAALKLHRAACAHIATGAGWHNTTSRHYKVCARERAPLTLWAETQAGALVLCKDCKP